MDTPDHRLWLILAAIVIVGLVVAGVGLRRARMRPYPGTVRRHRNRYDMWTTEEDRDAAPLR